MSRSPEAVLLSRLKRVPKGEQGRVAELAGISPSHFSRWLKGKVPLDPKLGTIKRLAEALGEPLQNLLVDDSGLEVAEPAAIYDERPSSDELARAAEHLAAAQRLLRGGGDGEPRDDEAAEVERRVIARQRKRRTLDKGKTA